MTKILILIDNKASNTKQSLCLAYGIMKIMPSQVETKVIEIKLSPFAKLPNFLKIAYFTKEISIDSKIKYDIIISCGRRLAKFNLLARKKYGHFNTKSIAILKPGVKLSKFDAVILPYHDSILESQTNNIINTYGAISFLDKDMINQAKKEWRRLSDQFLPPYICVMIGGSSRHFQFSMKAMTQLSQILNNVANNMQGTLFITTSRRTPSYAVQILKDYLECSYYLYDFNNPKSISNPYSAFLGFGDYFICTSDSISMISEIIATQKPVYLFNKGVIGDKYAAFTDYLLQTQSVKILEEDQNTLKYFTYPPINDPVIIAKKTLSKLKLI